MTAHRNYARADATNRERQQQGPPASDAESNSDGHRQNQCECHDRSLAGREMAVNGYSRNKLPTPTPAPHTSDSTPISRRALWGTRFCTRSFIPLPSGCLTFLKQKSAEPQKKVAKGSRLVAQLNRTASVQIALRLPGPDVEKARELATRKGIGYQTLLKMLVHEGQRREAKRA